MAGRFDATSLSFKPFGMTGLGQERLRRLRIVGDLRRVDPIFELRREDIVMGRAPEAFEHDVHQELPVDRMGQRLSHPHIVEWRLVVAHDDVDIAPGRHPERLDARGCGNPFEVGLLHEQHHVDVA